jgi:hypothetical protein
MKAQKMMCASGNTEEKNENINFKIYNISSFQAWTPTRRNVLAHQGTWRKKMRI